MRIEIKPISVNKVWQGKRFKTPAYKAYETELLYKLPYKAIQGGLLAISLEFGMSRLSDIDNPVKPLLDVLQKKYGFNDRDIYSLNIIKKDVKKGHEYIEFNIESYETKGS